MLSDKGDMSEGRSCYFIKLTVFDSVDIFIKPVFKQIIVESLNYFSKKKNLVVHAWCLMTHELQLIVSADGAGIPDIIADFRKFTSRIIVQDLDFESEGRRRWIIEKFKKNESASIWLPAAMVERLDSSSWEVIERIEEIHSGPVRDRIVSHPSDYLYSSAGDYEGRTGFVDVNLFSQDCDANSDALTKTISNMMWYR